MGTLIACRVAYKLDLKKLVMTSSMASVMGNEAQSGVLYKEDYFADPSKTIDVFYKAKLLSEKAAWDFRKNHQINLITINSGLILGPNLNDQKFTSGDLIKQILMGQIDLKHI